MSQNSVLISRQVKREFSINELIHLDKLQIESQIFIVNYEEPVAQHKYVQIKCTLFIDNNIENTMFQIIDVSQQIMLDKQKSDTHYQELITACVSHELRNPLNSLNSGNIEKAYLYEEIDHLLERHKGNSNLTVRKMSSQIKVVNEKLKQGLKIQENSTCLMQSIVQDQLDFAQLNAGKFRQNIFRFNIRESIEKVMSIQKKKAEESKIELVAEFLNIYDIQTNEDFIDRGMYSPIIESDE